MTQKEWISKMVAPAQKASSIFGYPASVLIAQSCQENGYGSDSSCDVLTEVNNVLGMKRELLNSTWVSDYWNGDYITKKTPEWYNGRQTYIYDDFRKYDSLEDCFCDYCNFMHDARYSVHGEYKYRDVLDMKDPQMVITAVMERGYCTDPNYANAIMNIIRKHNLTQYDVITKEGSEMKVVEKPNIIDRIAENEWQVPYHNANDAEYLAIHYLGVNGENPDLYNHGYGGHFYVSKTGQCYQAAKVSDEIWHVGKASYKYIHPYARNYNTIGIECATFTKSGRNDDDEPWYFTEETQEACARLAAWIMYHYHIPMENLLRHGDITTKHCPSPYIDNPGDGSNWTWERFKERVAYYLGGGVSDASTGLTETQKLVKAGQEHSINFTGVRIDTDGVRGRETNRQLVRVLQHGANLDRWSSVCKNGKLVEDGIIGDQTKLAFQNHYIKLGETQHMVTAVEIICYCLGKNPDGVESPGVYGNGLTTALGGVAYLSGEDILKLLD